MDRTRLKYRLFDRQRARYGPESDLVLQKYVTSTGYETVETIESGWCVGDPEYRRDDPTVSGEFFEVKIAENGTDLAPTFRGKLTHAEFGGYKYKIEGVGQPKQSVKVWTLRCGSTGERT